MKQTRNTQRIILAFTGAVSGHVLTDVGTVIVEEGGMFYALPSVVELPNQGAVRLTDHLNSSLSFSGGHALLQDAQAEALAMAQERSRAFITNWGPTLPPSTYDTARMISAQDEVEEETCESLRQAFLAPMSLDAVH